MNIFYLDRDPKIAAQMMCDKHVVKMILESAQILSTAHRVLDGDDYADKYGLYKIAHKNHPSTIWARSGGLNYLWLYNHMRALMQEYTHRYGKIHATERKGIIRNLSKRPYELRRGVGNTTMPQCMPSQYKQECSSSAYRVYDAGDKSWFAVWYKRDTPKWYTDRVELASA